MFICIKRRTLYEFTLYLISLHDLEYICESKNISRGGTYPLGGGQKR